MTYEEKFASSFSMKLITNMNIEFQCIFKEKDFEKRVKNFYYQKKKETSLSFSFFYNFSICKIFSSQFFLLPLKKLSLQINTKSIHFLFVTLFTKMI